MAESIDAVLERQHEQQYGYTEEEDDDDEMNPTDDDDDDDVAATEEERSPKQPRRLPKLEYNNLSKSPRPIRPLIFVTNDIPTTTTTSNHFWEKRVDLQFVGSVRSVAFEYGSHAIELSSSSIRNRSSSSSRNHLTDGDDDNEEEVYYDRLVLRAANNDEMKEWLFQFLRCIASFLMDMVAVRCGGSVRYPSPSMMNTTTSTTTAGDLHYPMTTSNWDDSNRIKNNTINDNNNNKNQNTSYDSSTDPSTTPHRHSDGSMGMGSNSPQRHYPNLNAMSHSFSYGSRPSHNVHTPLSHGHGRNSLSNQRRRRGISQQQQQGLDPVSPIQSQCDGDVTTTTRIVTPIELPTNQQNEKNWSTTTISPDTSKQPTDSIFVMDHQSPTLVAGALTSSDTNRNDASTTAPFIPMDVVGAPTTNRIHIESLCSSSPTPTLQYLPPPATKGKYIPPHLRHRNITGSTVHNSNTASDGPASNLYVPRHSRLTSENGFHHNNSRDSTSHNGSSHVTYMAQPRDDINEFETMDDGFIKLGGCSDPNHVVGSIQDLKYIPRKASQLGKVRTIPFGFSTSIKPSIPPEAAEGTRRKLSYEIGAVSECGVRDYNEDSFLISSNLMQAFTQLKSNDKGSENSTTIWDSYATDNSSHSPGLFAIFDGHCGDQASRFSAEELSRFIFEESGQRENDDDRTSTMGTNQLYASIVDAIERAMKKLDAEFCQLCVQGGREWDSGSTALIAALIDEHLIIANLGDARGIVGRSVDTNTNIDHYVTDGWNELPEIDTGGTRRCLWKEVTNIHSPNRDDERRRIETAGGWVTTESEIPVAQLKRMELDDDDVLDILHRCFADRQSCTASTSSSRGDVNYITSNKASAPHRVIQISRVCGILGVSRAIGDRELKASSYNETKNHSDDTGDNVDLPPQALLDDEYRWDSSHLGFMYPDGHDQYIVGNLISNKPEFQLVRVGEVGVYDEFLLLACDGLWDVLDPDDAYRITRDLLFDKQWSAKKTAGRLSELALHLGSSDNVTVIIVRFFLE